VDDGTSFGVVVSTVDAEPALSRTLASIAGQTHAPAQVVVLERGRSRNEAIAALEAPWVAFLDAGRSWAPHTLARFADAIRSAPDVHVVFGDHALERGPFAPRSSLAKDKHYRAVTRRAIAPGLVRCDRQALVAAVIRSIAFISTSSLAVRRDAFLTCGGFDERRDLPEELDLLLRLLAHSTAVVVEEILATGRCAPRSALDLALETERELRLWERIASAPERYPHGAETLLAVQNRGRVMRAALFALCAGRFGDVLGRFRARPTPHPRGERR
jgi:predicted O-methyltransferase YrrM